MTYKTIKLDGKILIDLTGDTAEAGDVYHGKTLHLSSGETATGTMPDIEIKNISTDDTAKTPVPIISTAGYAPTLSISGITVPASTSLTVSNIGTSTVSSVNTGTSAASWTGTVIVSAPTISTATTATTATIVSNGVLKSASFTNVTLGTGTADVQIVKSAGYTGTKYISAMTIPTIAKLTEVIATKASNSATAISTVTLNDYRSIESIYLNGAHTQVDNIYGTGEVQTKAGSTLASYHNYGTIENITSTYNSSDRTIISSNNYCGAFIKKTYSVANNKCYLFLKASIAATFAYMCTHDNAVSCTQDMLPTTYRSVYGLPYDISGCCLSVLVKNKTSGTQSFTLGHGTSTDESGTITDLGTISVPAYKAYLITICKKSTTGYHSIVVSELYGGAFQA